MIKAQVIQKYFAVAALAVCDEAKIDNRKAHKMMDNLCGAADMIKRLGLPDDYHPMLNAYTHRNLKAAQDAIKAADLTATRIA